MSVATEKLAEYLAAESAALKGISVRIGDRQLTRANLPEIIAGRKEWARIVAAEQAAAAAGGRGSNYAVADFSGCDR